MQATEMTNGEVMAIQVQHDVEVRLRRLERAVAALERMLVGKSDIPQS